MTHIELLKQQHLAAFSNKRTEHKRAVCELYRQYWAEHAANETSHMLLFSHFYAYLADNLPAEIYQNERIVGTNWHWRWQSDLQNTVVPGNLGHYSADFADFLHQGIEGKRAAARQICPQSEEQSINKQGFLVTLDAFSRYIEGYARAAYALAESAEDSADKQRLLTIAHHCEHLSTHPPVSFYQALQFVWFIECFLETEAGNAAVSFGRIDDYLYPYYQKDILQGTLTRDEALELIMAFYIKVSEGDESCMLTVGGDRENELSELFVLAQASVDMRQPSIAVRVCPDTSEALLRAAKTLALKGSGMPAMFNDDVVIAGLKRIGIDEASARDYGVVGCYEAAPQGSFSNTVACGLDLYPSLEGFVAQKDSFDTFEQFLTDYKAYFEECYVRHVLPRYRARTAELRAQISPFAGLALRGCLASGLTPGQGGDEYFLFGITTLGLGVLIDSIHTIKTLVFDQKAISLAYLKEQAAKNFEDEELYERIRSIKDFYGSNSPESNALARELSAFIADVIERHPIEKGVISSPALFDFTMDIYCRKRQASLNGRRQGELFSYGIMPCATPHALTLTDALLSSANVSCDRFPNGCPAMITLNGTDLAKDGVFETLVRSYFDAGGYHLAINTVNAQTLRQARERPQEHSDVMVKISGYSTQFVKLNDTLQTALTERAERGM